MLNHFFEDMYKQADAKGPDDVTWTKIQQLVHEDNLKELERIVLKTAKVTVKMPIIRTALQAKKFDNEDGTSWSIKKGATVILDIVS